jgi:branched-chain amino acid aminotransferase
MDQVDLIWKNGEFVPWEQAQTHVLSHGLHYGTGVFEGIRCYETERGPAIFRHADHLARLEKSAALYYLEIPYSAEQIRQATHELLTRNGLRSAYIRPLAYRGYGSLGLYAQDCPVDVIVAAFPWGAYLGEESKNGGIRAKVSSWRRISPGGSIPHAKASGSYLNSILAKTESHKAGYDEAILLDERGFVCEGSGENIFVVRDGEIVTPPSRARSPPTSRPSSRTRSTGAPRSTWSGSTSSRRRPESTRRVRWVRDVSPPHRVNRANYRSRLAAGVASCRADRPPWPLPELQTRKAVIRWNR